MTVGLTNPARLPVQLISAMPAAAADPPRKEVGSDQNIGSAVTIPTTAMIRPAIAIVVLAPACVHRMNPQAASRTGHTTCQRRSRVLSAWRPTTIIEIRASVYGGIV